MPPALPLSPSHPFLLFLAISLSLSSLSPSHSLSLTHTHTHTGCTPVIAVSRRESTRAKALALGADVAIDGTDASTVQGYLAHKKQPPPLGKLLGPRLSPTVGSSEGVVSYERGAPVGPAVVR